MKKAFSIIMVLIMVVFMGAGTKVDAKAKTASFSKRCVTIKAGKTSNLKSFLKNAGKSTITWKSSNRKVATVNKSGKVTAKKQGTAVIKAYIKQQKKTISVTVKVTKKTSTSKSSGKYRTLRVRCTAYCPCRKCSGGYGTNTASGKKCKEGRTIAVDRRVIPLGSKVVIDGHTYIAEDTGVRGNAVDIYMRSHSKCCKFGVRYKTVKIYR